MRRRAQNRRGSSRSTTSSMRLEGRNIDPPPVASRRPSGLTARSPQYGSKGKFSGMVVPRATSRSINVSSSFRRRSCAPVPVQSMRRDPLRRYGKALAEPRSPLKSTSAGSKTAGSASAWRPMQTNSNCGEGHDKRTQGAGASKSFLGLTPSRDEAHTTRGVPIDVCSPRSRVSESNSNVADSPVNHRKAPSLPQVSASISSGSRSESGPSSSARRIPAVGDASARSCLADRCRARGLRSRRNSRATTPPPGPG